MGGLEIQPSFRRYYMIFRLWVEEQKFMTLPPETRQGLYAAIEAAVAKVKSYKDPSSLSYDAYTSKEIMGEPGVHIFDVPYKDRKTGLDKPIPVYLCRMDTCGNYDPQGHFIRINYEYLQERPPSSELFRTIAHELGHATTFGMGRSQRYNRYITKMANVSRELDKIGWASTDDEKAKEAELKGQLWRPADSYLHNNEPIEAWEGISTEIATDLEDYYAALPNDKKNDLLEDIMSWLKNSNGNLPEPLHAFAHNIENFKKEPLVWRKFVQKMVSLVNQLRQSQPRQGWYHTQYSHIDAMHPKYYNRMNYQKSDVPALSIDDEVPEL